MILFKQILLELQANKQTIEEWLNTLHITKYKINSDNSVDVYENVNIGGKNLKKIPFKFGIVTGDFYCCGNNLTSLEGCPKIVDGHFNCSNNKKLKNLEGSPEKVDGHFQCSDNRLISLEGCPKEVNGSFDCSYNKKLNNSDIEWLKKNCKIKGNIINIK